MTTTADGPKYFPRLLSLANFSFLDQALVSAGNFTASILLARALGIYEFGRFTLVWMAVEFLMSLQFATILQPMLNIGPKQIRSALPSYFAAVAMQQGLFTLATTGLVALAASLAGSLLGEPTLSDLSLPLFAAGMAYQLHSFFRRFFFLRERPFLALSVDALRFTVQLPATLFLIFVDGGTTAVGLWIIAAACGTSAGLGALSMGRIQWDRAVFLQVLARHWEFSKWMLPSAVMHWMTSQVYVLMCGLVLGAAMTGGLRAAMGITGVLNILVQALDNFAPAQAARAFHQGGAARLRRYMIRLGLLMSVLILATIALLSVLPDLAMQLLYGPQYEGFGHLVRWLCAPSFVYSVVVILTICAAAMESTQLIFRSYLAATIFTLLAAYPLASQFGIAGVVATWLVVECIRALVLVTGLVKGTETQAWSPQVDAFRSEIRKFVSKIGRNRLAA
jgi:O-antigen/teichoic acid export membrane protein